MEQWLQNFAYRIGFPAGIYLLAGVLVSLVAFVTISYEVIKAALMNPVDSLRSE